MLLAALLALATEPFAPSRTAPSPADGEPWAVIAEARGEVRHLSAPRVDPIRDVGLCRLGDGEFVAHWTLLRLEHDATGVSRSTDGGATWSKPLILKALTGASLLAHEAKLHLVGTDGAGGRGRIVVRTSSDGGRSWSDVTDAQHGLVRGFDVCLSQPDTIRVQEGRAYKLFARDVRPFARAGLVRRSRTVLFVASAELGADWLDASSWHFGPELLLEDEDSGFDWSRACLLQPVPSQLCVRAFSRSEGDRLAVGARVERRGETLTPMKEDASRTLPETSFGATDVVDPQTYAHYVLAGEHFGDGYAGTLELWQSQTMKHWRLHTTLLDRVRPDLVGAACVVDGDDLLAVLAFAGTAQPERGSSWESRVVFLRVPQFRERTQKSPPLWSAPEPK
jgi:hypothetical protein